MARVSTKLLLVWVLALSLLGVQLVQHSALHDHSQHVVDCALCHFDTHEHALPQAGIAPDYESAATLAASSVQDFYFSRNFTPYQGRSPPQFLV